MKNWTVEYLLAVLEAKDWSANRLAKETGLAASTINRPLRERDWKYALKPDTIRKIHEATGIDPAPYMPSGLRESTPRFQAITRAPKEIDLNDIRIEVSSGVAFITAKVDATGIKTLREKLDALELIL